MPCSGYDERFPVGTTTPPPALTRGWWACCGVQVHVLREVRGRSPVDETWFLLDAMAPSTALRDAAQAMPIRDFGTVPLIR